MSFKLWLKTRQKMVTAELDTILSNYTTSNNKHLIKAIKYSSLNGGKRIRPLLLFSLAEMHGATAQKALLVACALELIHCYSLVHDDLPAMDNDDLRRGNLTCHKKFDEASAILAGDAMQSLAFSLINSGEYSSDIAVKLTKTLATASLNMVFGQALDMRYEKKQIGIKQLKVVHHHKTGDLISASLLLGAIVAENPKTDLARIKSIGKNLGIAFQIKDDILNATSTASVLGKPVGSDDERSKNTYVSILGLKKSQLQLEKIIAQVKAEIDQLNLPADKLLQLANLVINRKS